MPFRVRRYRAGRGCRSPVASGSTPEQQQQQQQQQQWQQEKKSQQEIDDENNATGSGAGENAPRSLAGTRGGQAAVCRPRCKRPRRQQPRKKHQQWQQRRRRQLWLRLRSAGSLQNARPRRTGGASGGSGVHVNNVRLQRLQSQPATSTLLALCDTSRDGAALSPLGVLIAQRGAARTGWVHSAGVLQDRMLANVAARDLRAVVQPKIGAGQSLDGRGREGDLFRIALHYSGPDPRITLRESLPSPEELLEIRRRLDGWDSRSPVGPWTRRTLKGIAERPETRAADLAGDLGLEKARFKTNVRKLKGLGLTESLEVGYRLSPRGRAVLEARGEDDGGG